jgi:hypothetical protein
LAELVDAVIGVDTHHTELADRRRDRHPVDQQRQHWLRQLLTWAFEHTPGPRLVMSIEGTRSYGGGVAGAAATAGLTVIERKKPTRTTRRGKGTSDPIDAHLAVLTALQLHADKLPRTDGNREASREQAVRHSEILRLALVAEEAARALKANRTELAAIDNDLVPGLTIRPGIGSASAAQAIVSVSHAGRCRNHASFAALANTNRLEASNGPTMRHRLM